MVNTIHQNLTDKILLKVLKLNTDYLQKKGFEPIYEESYDSFEDDSSKISFTSGENNLRVYYVYDLHDQYFCYQISYKQQIKEIFITSLEKTVNEINKEIKSIIEKEN